MRSQRQISGDKRPQRGRPENLKKGRKKGDPPTRKLLEQKVTDFCLYFLTHGESTKAAGLHVGLSPTYVYEFYKKPEVQAKLQELHAALGEKVLQEAANQYIGNRHFLDEHLASITADPKARSADRIAAARLLAEIDGLIDKGKVQQASFAVAQFIQTRPYLAPRFEKLKQEGEYRSEHLTLTLCQAAQPKPEDPKDD